jgi:heme/copper-type cytochrome/quinol oxidase subunit 3
MASGSGTLALPSAGDEPDRPPRAGRVLPMGMLMLAASGAMLLGTLIGVYLHLRHLTDPWPPQGVRIDDYIGNVLASAVLMGSITVEWANHALRRGERRQAVTALALTIGLGLSFLNLLSYAAGRTRFDAASHPYGLVVAAMTMLLGIAVSVGVGYITLTLFRVSGGQVSAAEPDQLRAAAWYWHFTLLAAVTVWYVVTVME